MEGRVYTRGSRGCAYATCVVDNSLSSESLVSHLLKWKYIYAQAYIYSFGRRWSQLVVGWCPRLGYQSLPRGDGLDGRSSHLYPGRTLGRV